MKCRYCGRENSEQDRYCAFCGKMLGAASYIPPASIPRFLPNQHATPGSVFRICPRCANTIPEEGNICSSCRWDLRKSFRAPSKLTLGSCLGLLFMRLLSFIVAVGLSYTAGFVGAFLGLGTTASSLLTGLVSTLVSTAPVVLRWLFGELRRVKTAGIPILVLCIFGLSVSPTHAQQGTAKNILQELIDRTGVSAVEWAEGDTSNDYYVTFKGPNSQYEITNAAQLVDLQDTYGSSGGNIWLDGQVNELNSISSCKVSPQGLYGLRAYYVVCESADNTHVEAILWAQERWGAAVFNNLYPDAEYTVMYLAETLHSLLSMPGAPGPTPTGSRSTQPAYKQKPGGDWTQADVTHMAVTVLSKFSARVMGNAPETIYRPDQQAEPGYPASFIKVCEVTHLQNNMSECWSHSMPNSRLAGIIRDKGGSLYTLDYPEGTAGIARLGIKVNIAYIPGGVQTLADGIFSLHAPNATSAERVPFHEMSAYGITMHHIADTRNWWSDYAFYKEPWLFYVSRQSYPALIPLANEPEILYAIVHEEGLYELPAPAITIPEQADAGPSAPPVNNAQSDLMGGPTNNC